ncbi:adenylate cyclase [Candidatus Roizmanbacteria bacterium CG_4_10_14_0_8_um_filter_39_9]|uniref:Adenylate cyclase n=1 Tax=Candidatus Roizmanbacteria bacterium CG_4_10_14_0_8_um_filter_39_9 TaxID=1974829 RepID=A0A2M7QC95_9BACT|nr:MAG: adenylate cyclase [Candidatus Roizmanbacteria bacterium CG_4_10_14_0_8_um_filter_39_9]
MPEEIERKFLVSKLPEGLETFKHIDISQGYLAIDGTTSTEVRLRKKGEKFFQTVKVGSGKTRKEVEVPITQEQFEQLWPLTEGKRIEKIRYEIPYDELTIELDVYHGKLEGLYTAEVEFKSEDISTAFTAPDWFGKEVTEDSRYKNQSLAVVGIPTSK